jgi:1-aminocyclopropane-1-carboxylate deaminase/D-cysteine desulfhydrase-like pyridoxal-dependent ACC family enzyme
MSVGENSKKFTLLNDPLLKKYGVNVFVMREDLAHPLTGGNKWRKLKYNLEKAKKENKTTLVTFGGAWSNHIAAAAFAGKESGFKTIGIIRGEKTEPLNSTLKKASGSGMELIFADRATYRDKEFTLNAALKNHDRKNYYIIPEGGSNYEGFKGCCEITGEIHFDFKYICCPCGTGTTLAGIASTLKEHQQAIGISVMKNNLSIEEKVKQFCIRDPDFRIFHNYHCGGYAKSTPGLDDFVKRFIEINKIEIEPVYTGKMFFGIYDLIEKGFFLKDDVVVAVHTGGLQYLK